jgi:hypothetical protein
MRHRRNYRPLFAAALACSLLPSAGCSNASGDRTPRDAPQPQLPCSLPYLAKAGPLPAQQDLDKPLAGDRWSELEAQDAAAYNQLFPKFNANIQWAADHCDAKPAPKSPPK